MIAATVQKASFSENEPTKKRKEILLNQILLPRIHTNYFCLLNYQESMLFFFLISSIEHLYGPLKYISYGGKFIFFYSLFLNLVLVFSNIDPFF